jgi:uncharacterized protein involved in exopolysaccharide biosynthesis
MPPFQTPAPEAEELNLQHLLAALARQWPFIVAGVVLGGIAASWHTSRIKPTWEGAFQIVLASSDAGGGGLGGMLGSNPLLANIAGLGGGGGKGAELETEVKILESPSVLRPVFDQVRARKAALGEDINGYNFNDWIGNLTIKLEEGTSVLAISYRDTEKSLILPVLRDVSEVYQAYSSRERNESLKNGLKYAEDQIRIYRHRADASFRALNSFGLTYGIAASGGVTGGSDLDLSKLLNNNSQASAGPAVSVQGGSSSFQSKGDPLGQLAELNQQLIRLQQTFTKNDPSVIALSKERDALRRYIETSAVGSIAYPGRQALTKEQAQSILLRYQELERKANRDQSTLDSMESALLSLQLEQARATKPWELISAPALLDRPVAPRPMRNLAFGLVAGLVLGSSAALLADRRSGRVYEADDIAEALGGAPLAQLPGQPSDRWSTRLTLLSDSMLAGATSVALLPIGIEEGDESLQSLRQLLQQLLPQSAVSTCNNLLEASRCQQQLLITAPGAATHIELAELRQQLKLLPKPISGWILVKAS